MSIAFLFAGQGAQYLGMGRELYETEKIVKDTFYEANEVLDYDLVDVMFHREELLHQTVYTQPAILTVGVAITRLLASKGIKPDVAAGLSLGEYTALVASGVFGFQDAVQLVSKRGQFMNEAAPKGSGKMVAVMHAEKALVQEICEKASSEGIVSPANYNTPHQIVIGGAVEAVDLAVALLREAGIKRTIELNVSGPFHTAILAPASVKLGNELQQVSLGTPQFPVISNTTAKVFEREEIKGLLVKQVMSSVLFEQSVETMREMGADTFIEIGPGKVLSGFLRKIDRDLSVMRVENEETLRTCLQSQNSLESELANGFLKKPCDC